MNSTRWLAALGVVVTVGCGPAQPPQQSAGSTSGTATSESAAALPATDLSTSDRSAAALAAGSQAVSDAAANRPALQRAASAEPPDTPNAPDPPAAATRLTAGAVDSRLRSQVAAWKRVPYRDNGTTKSGIGNPGFTRALVQSVFDVSLPDKVDAQMRTGKLVEPSAVEPGDLVFFDGKGFGPFRSRSVGIALARGEAAIATKDLRLLLRDRVNAFFTLSNVT